MEAADIIRIRQDESKTSEMKFHLAVSFHSNALTLIVVNMFNGPDIDLPVGDLLLPGGRRAAFMER
jgi:hypothetical protein